MRDPFKADPIPVEELIKHNFNDYELRDSLKLTDILKESIKIPNYLTLDEFNKFVILFRKHPVITDARESELFSQKIKTLTEEFRKKVDMYKETHIIKSNKDRTPLLKLPPIFVSAQTIIPSMETMPSIIRNHKRTTMTDRQHIVQSEAAMLRVVRNTQTHPDHIKHIAEVAIRTHHLLEEFYKHNPAARPQSESKPSDTSSEQTYISNEIEDFG